MCGICGIVERDGASPDSRVLEEMNQRILHRGPDEGGSWIEDRAGLAMRRLAIIDLSGGHQPMFNEDGSIAIVFNGEIYNYQELRPELEAAKHRLYNPQRHRNHNSPTIGPASHRPRNTGMPSFPVSLRIRFSVYHVPLSSGATR